MNVESYVKKTLSEKGISTKDAAAVFGYALQSFRNKLSKRNLSLHDVLMLCLLCDKRLVIEDRASNKQYVFDTKLELSTEDFQRYSDYRNRQSKKVSFSDWFDKMNLHDEQGLFSTVERSREENYEHWSTKRDEGRVFIECVNFVERIEICGAKCREAAEWLKDKNAEASTPEQEWLNGVTAERFFDVHLTYCSAPIFIGKNIPINADEYEPI